MKPADPAGKECADRSGDCDADCIIVAADAKVPMERFDGKKVIECQVSDGISKADQLIDRAINGDAPVYHAQHSRHLLPVINPAAV